MLFLNIIITLLCIWIVMYMNTAFLQPALLDRYRFRLFSLRDRLAMAAMRGEIEADSTEYSALCTMINMTIRLARNVEPLAFVQFILQLKNKETAYSFEDLKTMSEAARADEYKKIVNEYFAITCSLFRFNTSVVFYLVALPMAIVAKFSSTMARWLKKFKDAKGYVSSFAH